MSNENKHGVIEIGNNLQNLLFLVIAVVTTFAVFLLLEKAAALLVVTLLALIPSAKGLHAAYRASSGDAAMFIGLLIVASLTGLAAWFNFIAKMFV